MKDIRTVLHAHSLWSYDGYWTLSRIAQVFGAFGVDAVMMSEHDTGFDPESFTDYRAACAVASTPRCTLIPGIEYSSPDNDIHILTWGLGHFLDEHRPVAETLARVREAEGVAVFAHPGRRDAWEKFDPSWTPELSAVEFWNRKTDGYKPGARARALIAETGLPAIVGCDFHRPRHLYPLTNRIAVSDTLLLEKGLVTGLLAGKARPQAFGRPLQTASGAPKPDGIHAYAENFRRIGRRFWPSR